MKWRFFARLSTDQYLIFFIIAAGAVLRFWNYSSIPFSYDEFSAIFRTNFSTFHELLEKGVIADNHPALVQVFMYYWVMIFGNYEPMVKLPFTLCGLASIYLIYILGKKWFSATAGLISASFLSFLQFPLMYSQLARPYATGLFFVLLMVYFWTLLILGPGRRFYLNLSGYIIASALCAYNHHFSLLMVPVVAVSGFFMLERSRRISYVISWGVIFLLYIPHLSIFFIQLSRGGIGGWLGKPRPDFILDYLQYAFQFSWYVYAMAVLVILLSLIWRKQSAKTNFRFLLISLVWFAVPYLTGYLYSVMVNPVLQYSVLIFSFPFLLFLLFSRADTDMAWKKIVLVLLPAVVIIPSLVIQRKHYELFYHSRYSELLLRSREAANIFKRKNCFIYLDSYTDKENFYLSKPEFSGFRPDCIHEPFSAGIIQNILDTVSKPVFIYGALSNSVLEDYPGILDKYPFLISHQVFNEGDFYVFTKSGWGGEAACSSGTSSVPVSGTGKSGGINEYYFSSEFDAVTGQAGGFMFDPGRIILDSVAGKVFMMDSTIEFSPTFSASLRDIVHHRNDIIDCFADVEIPAGNEHGTEQEKATGKSFLQITVFSENRLFIIRSAEIPKGSAGPGFHRYYVSLRLAEIDWRHHGLSVNTFIWNPNKQILLIRRHSFRIRTGNPYLYGLYRKIR